MQIYNYPNIIAASTVMNTTINSAAMQIQNHLFYCIQIVFTGTPTGSFKLQGSNDNSATKTAAAQFPYVVTNWTDIPNSSQNVTEAGSVLLRDPAYFSQYNFVRAVYTDTSSGISTAIITVSTFNAKG